MLDRVRLRGERLTIERDGEPIAVLSSVGEPVTWRKVAQRLAELGFPGDGFADDVEAAQAAQPRPEPPAWPARTTLSHQWKPYVLLPPRTTEPGGTGRYQVVCDATGVALSL